MKCNPYLKDDERDFFDNVKSFALEKVFPSVEERDDKAIWDNDLWMKMGEMGLNGIAIPEEYGGQGASCLQCCHASEAFNAGSGDGGLGLAWGAHTIIGTLPIVFFGSDEQKKKYLPKMATGEWISGLGLTESASGSDAAGMETKAKKEGDYYILNGNKMFITNGPVGELFIIMARTTEKKSRSPMGISAFIVQKDMPGFSVSKVLRKLGHHTSTTAELSFDDMKVPAENLLGPLNSGFLRIGKATLEWERTVLIAALVGGSEFTLTTCLRYAQEREQFGKAIINFYAIKEKLAKNWIYMQVCRRYLYYVANQKDAGDSLAMQSSILKLISSETGEDIAAEAVQLHGGYGYMREYHVERYYRDIKLGTIGGGTSEVQRSIIASSFPGYEKFILGLEKMLPDEVRSSAESSYTTSVMGGELELLSALHKIVQEAHKKIKKNDSQAITFSFADSVMLLSLIQQSFWDVKTELVGYSEESRKRDFGLATYYLSSKYLSSIRNLTPLAEKATHDFFDAYLKLSQIEESVISCVQELQDELN